MDVSSQGKRLVDMRIGLRGKLAQDYETKRRINDEHATKWVRQLVMDAVGGHRQVGYRIDPDMEYGEKLIIGLNAERGTLPDW